MTIAVVTGGSRGLGRNASLRLAEKGVDIIFTYKSNIDEANKTVKEIEALGRKAMALQLDTGKVQTFETFSKTLSKILAEKFGTQKFDYLLNNAGMALYQPFMESTEEQFDDIMNVHLKGVFFLTQKLVPLMNDGGKILNVSSGLARFSLPGSSVYGCMKGAVEVLSRYLALELGARGISVNTIAPGAIETDFGGGRVRDNKEMNGFISSQTALGRVGKPDDIGEIMAQLLAGNMTWINGQRIEASGGFRL